MFLSFISFPCKRKLCLYVWSTKQERQLCAFLLPSAKQFLPHRSTACRPLPQWFCFKDNARSRWSGVQLEVRSVEGVCVVQCTVHRWQHFKVMWAELENKKSGEVGGEKRISVLWSRQSNLLKRIIMLTCWIKTGYSLQIARFHWNYIVTSTNEWSSVNTRKKRHEVKVYRQNCMLQVFYFPRLWE